MKPFNTIAIIGTGLIGGSLAMDIKRKKIAKRIIGISRHKRTIQTALKKGIIDTGSTSLSAIKGADLVILATPVNTLLDIAVRIKPYVKPGCIVTDVGSTKEKIVTALSRVFPGFVGSHPLAGSEKRGIDASGAGLFKDSFCIITPLARTKKNALHVVEDFWRTLGAKVIRMPAALHDTILASVSHTPHIAAFALINSVPEAFMRFAPSSLKDTTRVASSDAQLWAEIFLSNKKNMRRAIAAFQKNISLIDRAIKANDMAALIKLISSAKKKRDLLTL